MENREYQPKRASTGVNGRVRMFSSQLSESPPSRTELMNHLAIDLETLSLEPNAHILSIGAVFFDPATVLVESTRPNAHVKRIAAAWATRGRPCGEVDSALGVY